MTMLRQHGRIRLDARQLSRLKFSAQNPQNAERSRARSAAGFDDSLAAVARRAAVIAVMAGCVVKIAGLGQCKPPRGIADDESSLA